MTAIKDCYSTKEKLFFNELSGHSAVQYLDAALLSACADNLFATIVGVAQKINLCDINNNITLACI